MQKSLMTIIVGRHICIRGCEAMDSMTFVERERCVFLL